MAKSATKQSISPQATQRLRAVAGAVGNQESDESARLLYDRIRLGIMSALSVNQRLSFAELKDILGTNRRQSEQTCAAPRRRKSAQLQEGICRTRSAHALQPDSERQARIRQASGTHGNTDCRNEAGLAACMSQSSWTAMAAGPSNADCRAAPDTASVQRPQGALSKLQHELPLTA